MPSIYRLELCKMAKFAIALCILLIACEARGSPISYLEDKIRSKLDSYAKDIESQEAKLDKTMATANIDAAEFDELMYSTIQEVLEQSSCTSPSIDFAAMAEGIRITTYYCMDHSLENLKTDYASIKTGFANFAGVLNDIKIRTAECSSDAWNHMYCVLEIWESLERETSDAWDTLLAKLAAFMHGKLSIESAVISCGFTSAIEALQKKVEEC